MGEARRKNGGGRSELGRKSEGRADKYSSFRSGRVRERREIKRKGVPVGRIIRLVSGGCRGRGNRRVEATG